MIVLSGIGPAIPFELLLELGAACPQVVFEADETASTDPARRSWHERFFNARYRLRRGARIGLCGMGALAVRTIELGRLLRACEHVRLTCRASELADGTMDAVRNHLFAAFRATQAPRRLLVPWARGNGSWLSPLHGIPGLAVVVDAEHLGAAPQQSLPGVATIIAGATPPRASATADFLLTPVGDLTPESLRAVCEQLDPCEPPVRVAI